MLSTWNILEAHKNRVVTFFSAWSSKKKHVKKDEWLQLDRVTWRATLKSARYRRPRSPLFNPLTQREIYAPSLCHALYILTFCRSELQIYKYFYPHYESGAIIAGLDGKNQIVQRYIWRSLRFLFLFSNELFGFIDMYTAIISQDMYIGGHWGHTAQDI
jgi:hypothetical protein